MEVQVVQPCWTEVGMILFDFWVVIIVFSFGWHTISYRLAVVWCVEAMEHFSIAFHPKDFCLPNSAFAVAFWVIRVVRHGGVGRGAGVTCNTMP